MAQVAAVDVAEGIGPSPCENGHIGRVERCWRRTCVLPGTVSTESDDTSRTTHGLPYAAYCVLTDVERADAAGAPPWACTGRRCAPARARRCCRLDAARRLSRSPSAPLKPRLLARSSSQPLTRSRSCYHASKPTPGRRSDEQMRRSGRMEEPGANRGQRFHHRRVPPIIAAVCQSDLMHTRGAQTQCNSKRIRRLLAVSMKATTRGIWIPCSR